MAAEYDRKRSRRLRVSREQTAEQTPESIDKGISIKKQGMEQKLKIIEDDDEEEQFNYAPLFEPLQDFDKPN